MAKINTKALIETPYKYMGRTIYIQINAPKYHFSRVTMCNFDIETWSYSTLKERLIEWSLQLKGKPLSAFDAEVDLQIIVAKYNTYQFIDDFRDTLRFYSYYDNRAILAFK